MGVAVFEDETEVPIAATNRLPMPDEEARRIERAGAIAPPYQPHYLAAIFEQSSALRPAVEALQENVDGHGHRFEPLFDPTKPKAREIVSDAILYERAMQIDRGGGAHSSLIPTEMDVDMRLAEIDVRMRLERMKLDALYSACVPGSSFVKLRKRLRRDLEVTGNAYLGIRRDNRGEVAEFEYLPSVMMRLRPIVTDSFGRPIHVAVPIAVRRTPITIDYVKTYRAFRTYVQFGLTRDVYFKQFGDPRCFSARHGNCVEHIDSLAGNDAPATEVIHFKIDSALYEYGVPRWIGAVPSVTGLRASQEVNASHFDNNAIPRMLFLIAGGTLKDGADEKLKTLLRAHSKGRDHYGACVIVQATPASNNPQGRVTIEAKPLKEAVPDDGLFLNYGARSRDEVLSQWRLPKFAVGHIEDVNKATASEGMLFVENQVYQPHRFDFDTEMDVLHSAEGIHFWRFVSNSPISRDPTTATQIVEGLARAGGQTINDARRAAAEIQNQVYQPIKADWADLPVELAKLVFSGAMPPSATANGPVTKSAGHTISSPHDLAQWLVAARDALARGEAASFAAEAATTKGTTLVVPISGDALADLVEFS